LKTLAKKVASTIVAASGLEWLRDRAARRPAAVLCFHRVTDSIPEDGITISTSRFRWIVVELKHQYRVISMSQLISELEAQTNFERRTVVITFDDGYLDNHDSAAPLLSEMGLSATFFVAAGLIGTKTELPSDDHVKGRVAWMEWNHIKELQTRGFEIGSHTLSHCDLSKISGEEARREIFDSRSLLEDKLGSTVVMFAYPGGGKAHITEGNKSLVMEAGYRCCCSAHGGFVYPGSSCYDIHRLPINRWYQEPVELHFELRRLNVLRWAEGRQSTPSCFLTSNSPNLDRRSDVTGCSIAPTTAA
jgi:peptidoglycan/xylan/chitin deacetylase (PgdA/CDA1 family)